MELKNNNYYIGGVSIEKLAKEYSLPLYVYNFDTITEQYRKMEEAFSDCNFRIKYACKANSNLSILHHIRNLGGGLDTVSIQEVRLGKEAGFKPEEILYTPNSVSLEEIKEAVDEGVRINIDNISILEQFGHEYGSQVPVCIRINPHVLAGGNSKIQTGHIDSKFGISIHQMRHTLRVIKANNIRVEGIHMHTGSDILDPDAFLNGLNILLDSAFEFENLNYIDFGSGFKVAYRSDDVTTDLQELGRKVSARFNEFCKEYGKDLELWCEPGKFLVSESGYFLMQTNVIKHTVATVFAGVDSGFNHMIRPMFYDAHHEIVNVSNPGGTSRIYSIVGYICETDTFASDRKLNEVREGDILAIKNAGAYAFSMSSNFNSRFRPAEVLIKDKKTWLIRKRETFEDLTRHQIVPDMLKEKVKSK